VVSVGFETTAMPPQGVSLQWMVTPTKGDEIRVVLAGDSENQDRKALASQPNKESEIPFMVTLADGIVTVTTVSTGSSGGHPERISVTSKNRRADLKKVVLSCSGAKVRFSKVMVSSEP
jgi:hypothetical protein